MKTISKFLLLSLILLLVGLGTISAAEDMTNSTNTADTVLENTVTDENVIAETTTNNVDTNNQDKIIEKNNELTTNNVNTKSASTITVTNKTYDQFFHTENGKVVSSDLIMAGDTINLKGTFTDVVFAVDKKITLTSKDKSAKLYNCTVRIMGTQSSGSTVSNLEIINSKEQTNGIHINQSNNLLITDNIVKVNGVNSFPFAASLMNNSIIKFNTFQTAYPEGSQRAHTAVAFGQAYYNSIANNTVYCLANGIYLSNYGNPEAGFTGGYCHYNNITGNKVTAPKENSSYCYTIQIMGGNNIVSYNTVSGGFRGISSEDNQNNVISYNDVNGLIEGIYAGTDTLVTNNNVHVTAKATGITIGGSDARVCNNVITSESGPGIEIKVSGVNITSNNITSNTNGIFLKGMYSSILIEKNKIVSGGDGILFLPQSGTKLTNHIKVNGNNINSAGSYAINFEKTGSRNSAEINITVTSSNVLKSAKGSGTKAYLPPSNYAGTQLFDEYQVINVTMDNYDQWFDDGTENIKVLQNATVYLIGTFDNVDFKFTRKVHLIGVNCVINQGTITLTDDAHESTITNITVKNHAKRTTSHAIEVFGVNNCEITQVNLSNIGLTESLGLFLYDASGTTFSNSKITTTGDYINNGILAYSSDSNNFERNTINVKQSAAQTGYASSIMFNEKIGTIQEVLHCHGIMLLYSSDNTLYKNKIKGTSGFTKYTFPNSTCQNSIVGIDIYFDSHNNQVISNNVDITSYCPYVYGMGVLGGYWGSSITSLNATGNVYRANVVKVKGGYFATGFIAGRNSANTNLISNKIYVDSEGYSLGVTLENSTTTTVSKNTLTLTGPYVYSMELFDSSNNIILYNTIDSKGTYPYGIAGYRSSNNKIKYNSITTREVNLGTSASAGHADVIPCGKEAIMFMSTSSGNNITINTINTNASVSVSLTDETKNNLVQDNSLRAGKKYGDASVVNSQKTNKISNNFLYFVNATAEPVIANIGDTVNFTAYYNTTTQYVGALKANFVLGVTDLGTVKVSDGKAVLTYKVNSIWKDTVYPLKVYFSGTNFQNATATSEVEFVDGLTLTTVQVPKVLQVVGTTAKIVANITTTTGGKIGSGTADFYMDNKLLGTVDVKLGQATFSYAISKKATPKVHTIKVVYSGTNDYAGSSDTNDWALQSQTSIQLANHTGTIGEVVTITGNITSGGKAISSGKVNVKVGGVVVGQANIVNGKVEYKYTIPTSMKAGNYNLQLLYDGTDVLSWGSKTMKIKVRAATPVFHYNTTKVKVGATANVVVAIDNGKTGSSLLKANGGNVILKLNGVTLRDSNNKEVYGAIKDGKITFKFTAPEQLVGYQNLTFVYKGNDQFNEGRITVNNALLIEKA